MSDPTTRPAPDGTSRRTLLLPLLAYGLGSVDWQRVLRRTGMPFRSPADHPARAAAAVSASAAGGLLATAAAGAALAAVTRVPADRFPSAVSVARVAALVPLPLVGTAVGGYLEAVAAWRCARESVVDETSTGLSRAGLPADALPAAALPAAALPAAVVRAAVGAAAFGLVHGLVSTAVERLLDAALADPPRPPAAPPASRLNVVGPDVGDAEAGPDGFVVYLDGVGRYERRTTPVGRAFAAAVAERLPRWSVVLSLMPNDVTQEPAWLRPVTGRLWRRLHRASPSWLLARGVWEAAVAVDPRYRERLADEHTRQVVAHLRAAGYRPGSGVPVVLVGLSGGAQTALRVASEVARSLGGAPLDVVTFGAFADGSADLEGIRRVHAVVSWGDPAELLPVLLFPSRWTALGVGAWREAKRAGTVVVRRHDWATHIGAGGYLSPTAHAPDGRTRLAQAADVVAASARQLLGGRSRVGSW